MKKLSYVKLYEKWCLYFPLSALQSFFSFPASSLFGTQQQLTHPPVKSSTLPLRKMPVFQGVAPRHTIFTSSCVIPLWDLATAHSPAGKELNSSSFNQSCFSGLIVVWCSHIILTGLSLFWCPPILILKPYMHLKQCFGLPQNGLRLRSLYCNDTWTSRYYSCKYCQF